ncbi:MAG: DegQ family serine endoprotease [Gammaproteobacteria bacterium]|nr:DegQ family serine endoprotease [Gammaproteobacteria bacterium]
MSIDRRSFKIGVIAGLFLVVGIAIGMVFAVRMKSAESATAFPGVDTQPLPVKVDAGPDFVPIVKADLPAIVNISTTRLIKSPAQTMNSPFGEDPFFRQFFGDQFFHNFQIPREERESALGSGVIVSPNGYIITNNHVIAKADTIKVILGNNRVYKGKVIGADPLTDIAVVKINAKNLPVIPWGNSKKLQVGQYVLAMGNPFGLNQTVTMGIVSALGRENVGIDDYEDFIQTDAAINPGNSGGALVNTRGQLVGINTAIYTRSGGYMGIGFAIPSNMARSVMTQLIEHGRVIRGWLGVSIQEVTPALAKNFGLREPTGALVGDVFKGSPAARAGLRTGDVIIKYEGKEIDTPTTLRNLVAATPVGKEVEMEVIRNRKAMTLRVKIAEQTKKDLQISEGKSGQTQESQHTLLSGLTVQNLTPEIASQLGLPHYATGVVIAEVNPDSAAAAVGLEPGDVITQINRQTVHNLSDYHRITSKLGKDQSVLLLIKRKDTNMFVVINR